MMAETRALRDGFKLCSDKGIQVNDIESYSQVMVDSILGLISTPLHVLYLIRECISLLSSGMMVSHIYRQGNSIADRLASHAYSHRSDCIVEAASSLLQTSLYNDKEGLYSDSCSRNAFFHQSHVRNRKRTTRTTKGLSILGVILTRK